jgi:hypothetical protein
MDRETLFKVLGVNVGCALLPSPKRYGYAYRVEFPFHLSLFLDELRFCDFVWAQLDRDLFDQMFLRVRWAVLATTRQLDAPERKTCETEGEATFTGRLDAPERTYWYAIKIAPSGHTTVYFYLKDPMDDDLAFPMACACFRARVGGGSFWIVTTYRTLANEILHGAVKRNERETEVPVCG